MVLNKAEGTREKGRPAWAVFAMPGPARVPSGAIFWICLGWMDVFSLGLYFLSGLLAWVLSALVTGKPSCLVGCVLWGLGGLCERWSSGCQYCLWGSRVLGTGIASSRAEGFYQSCGLGYGDEGEGYCWQKSWTVSEEVLVVCRWDLTWGSRSSMASGMAGGFCQSCGPG